MAQPYLTVNMKIKILLSMSQASSPYKSLKCHFGGKCVLLAARGRPHKGS
jgi:hypothetical protein